MINGGDNLAGPQLEKGFTALANDVLEDLASAELNGSQFRIVLYIIRRTWGECERNPDGSIQYKGDKPLKKKMAPISNKDFMNSLKMPETTLEKNIKELVRRNVLLKKTGQGGKKSEYGYQKLNSLWLPSELSTPTPENGGCLKKELSTPSPENGGRDTPENGGGSTPENGGPLNKSKSVLNKLTKTDSTEELHTTARDTPTELSFLLIRFGVERETITRYWEYIDKCYPKKISVSEKIEHMQRWMDFPIEDILNWARYVMRQFPSGKPPSYLKSILINQYKEQFG